MAKRILLVHKDREFAAQVRAALLGAGQEVVQVFDPFRALDDMEREPWLDLLITGVRHGDGKPNGIALARMARYKCPSIAVILVGASEFSDFAEGLGVFLSTPVPVPEVVHVAIGLLGDGERRVSAGPLHNWPQDCGEREREVVDLPERAAG
jgi:DNA-binding NtrC family response regulator